jgi:hypothetical protein
MAASIGPEAGGEDAGDGAGGVSAVDVSVFEGDDPPLAVRRTGDRCFFAVEEVTGEGVIVEGFLIRFDEVEEFRMTVGAGDPGGRGAGDSGSEVCGR